MKRFVLTLCVVLFAATAAFAQKRTVAEEKERLQTLLRWAKTGDVPSRHTAHEEMVRFNQWIDAELLSLMSSSGIRERQLFWWVLYDRRCRKALSPAYKMLPDAITRCREAQIAVHNILECRQKANKARRAGNNDVVERMNDQIAEERRKVQWNEITQGDEVSILVAFLVEFGHEKEFNKLMTIAIDSSLDDALAKGNVARRRRTFRGKPLPGGTDLWNAVYVPVWEGLRTLARRPLDKKKIASTRKKFFSHFEKLAKSKKLGPNQEAALQNFQKVKNALLKTEEHRGNEGEKEDDDGSGVIKM